MVHTMMICAGPHTLSNDSRQAWFRIRCNGDEMVMTMKMMVMTMKMMVMTMKMMTMKMMVMIGSASPL